MESGPSCPERSIPASSKRVVIIPAMKVIRGVHNLRAHHKGCVATLGNFDGVHHGHQMILRHLVDKASEYGVPSLLITFEPQPSEFFGGTTAPARLTRFREKLYLVAKAGIDRVLLVPFNEHLAKVTAEEVIDTFLVDSLGVRHVAVGDDARFGREAKGDYRLLRAAGQKYGFGVSNFGTLVLDGERVSSTRVRECLMAGDLRGAERLLGHPYFIMGRVVTGQRLGRSLGSPTANIRLQRSKAALTGVYAVQAEWRDFCFPGVANIGLRPTVDGRDLLLEVHLLDFDEDIYGEHLRVTFCHKLRDERKFDSVDALREQIRLDAARAGELLADEPQQELSSQPEAMKG